jgi:hypothetical protein
MAKLAMSTTTTSPRWVNQLAGFQEKGFMCPLIPMRASHRQRPFLHTRTDKQVDLDPMFHSPFTWSMLLRPFPFVSNQLPRNRGKKNVLNVLPTKWPTHIHALLKNPPGASQACVHARRVAWLINQLNLELNVTDGETRRSSGGIYKWHAVPRPAGRAGTGRSPLIGFTRH